MPSTFEFDLPDEDGKIHHYEGTRVKTTVGLEIAKDLTRVVTPTMVGMLKGQGDITKVEPLSFMTSVEALLQTLDIEFVQKKILGNVLRDKTPVAPADQFDEVYAGNYTELWAAVYEVVRYNRFLPLLNSAPSASDLMTTLRVKMTEARLRSESATGNGPLPAASTPGSPPSPT